MDDGEVAVDAEGLLIGFRGVGGLSGSVEREAEVVPGLGVRGEEFDRGAQLGDGVLWFAFLHEAFAVEERFRAGRRAAGEERGHADRNGSPESRHPAREASLEGGRRRSLDAAGSLPELRDATAMIRPRTPGGASVRVSGRQHSVSRYAFPSGPPSAPRRNRRVMPRVILTLLLLCQSFCLRADRVGFAEPGILGANEGKSRVVIVRNPAATRSLAAVPAVVSAMVSNGVVALTGKASASDAWRSLVKTQDIVGVKVYSVPGPSSGTRPAVAEAVVRGLIDAGHPASRVVIWDRREADLRAAGFGELAESLGVRISGAVDAGLDPDVAYENSVLGQLVYGDLEFERDTSGGGTNRVVGRRSHLSRLVTREITRHIIIAPMLNHNHAGVSGILYTVASGCTDNFIRFETNPALLLSAVPEIFGQPVIADHVAFHLVDALIGQYEGSQRGLLHYSSILNELRFSTDPVALDTLSLVDLNRIRVAAGAREMTNGLPLFENARMLELGTDDLRKIDILRVE